MGILDKLMGRSGDEDYVNIDLGQFEEVSAGSSSEILVRMAELNDIDVLPDIKAEIERGNVVLVDISPLRREKGLLDEAIGELKDAVEDLRGDIAGLGDNLVIVVPRRMRIDRENVLGGRIEGEDDLELPHLLRRDHFRLGDEGYPPLRRGDDHRRGLRRLRLQAQ